MYSVHSNDSIHLAFTCWEMRFRTDCVTSVRERLAMTGCNTGNTISLSTSTVDATDGGGTGDMFRRIPNEGAVSIEWHRCAKRRLTCGQYF